MNLANDRLLKLQALLERQPNDTFLLYGLAMEHKKVGDTAKALELLQRVLQLDVAYCYAYHQKGLIHEMRGELEAARQAYGDGIAAATQAGDTHACSEIQMALTAIE